MSDRHYLEHRDPGLVITIINAIHADNLEDLKPAVSILATELTEADDHQRTAETMSKTIRELLRFGVIRHALNRHGKSEGLELTDLGKLWAGIDTTPLPIVDDDGTQWGTFEPIVITDDDDKLEGVDPKTYAALPPATAAALNAIDDDPDPNATGYNPPATDINDAVHHGYDVTPDITGLDIVDGSGTTVTTIEGDRPPHHDDPHPPSDTPATSRPPTP